MVTKLCANGPAEEDECGWSTSSVSLWGVKLFPLYTGEWFLRRQEQALFRSWPSSGSVWLTKRSFAKPGEQNKSNSSCLVPSAKVNIGFYLTWVSVSIDYPPTFPAHWVDFHYESFLNISSVFLFTTENNLLKTCLKYLCLFGVFGVRSSQFLCSNCYLWQLSQTWWRKPCSCTDWGFVPPCTFLSCATVVPKWFISSAFASSNRVNVTKLQNKSLLNWGTSQNWPSVSINMSSSNFTSISSRSDLER